MPDFAKQPSEIGGGAAVAYIGRFFLNQLAAQRSIADQHGTYVRLRNPVRIGNLPTDIVFSARSDINRQILEHPETWRTVDVSAGGKSQHASRRLVDGIVRMRGAQHIHYRKLVVPPLRPASIRELDDLMRQTADSAVSAWPTDKQVDIWLLVRKLMQQFAITLLFGADMQRGNRIADIVNQLLAKSWSLKANLLRLDVPGMPYAWMLRTSELLESLILEWVEAKRGVLDRHDLLSIIVNSPDEYGNPPSDILLTGHVPTLFGAAYETCQNAMIWSLILIAAHPNVADGLADELAPYAKAGLPSLAQLHGLPLLDKVVKETMRILPPVPNQHRVALADTGLTGIEVPKGARAILSAFILNRNPDLFPEPDRFLPERWGTIQPSPYQCAVFSAGPRACPGSYFGISVVKVGLATILSRHRIGLSASNRLGYRVAVTLSPSGPVLASFVRSSGRAPDNRVSGPLKTIIRFPHG